MAITDIISPEDIINPDPAGLSHRFGVNFFTLGVVPNFLDFRFQRVGGISAEVQLDTIHEGGENLYSQRVPGRMNYENLVLERGYPLTSRLNREFNFSFSTFTFFTYNVLVTLYSEIGIPIGAWFYMKAYPVKWSVSDFDGQANSVVIDTMELAYQRFQILRL